MLKLTQNNVTIEIRNPHELDKQALEAVVEPATDQQRRQLGTAAVGHAWMAWSPIETTLKLIKFMPPQTTNQEESRKLLLSYRNALCVADRHEVSSLALPLPQQADLPLLQERWAAGLARVILETCLRRRHLRRLQLVASGNQEAVLYANWLVEIQSNQAHP
jgi:hypothetical protein|tara:strand:- start:9424 stop:9909 length:486 start_codon:yes stop_codon:yes gene_type:complete